MALSEYQALSGELLRRAAALGQPLHGAFELTARCNLRCRMCYVCEPAGDTQTRSRELTAPQWLELTRQAVDAGMVFLLLTGGEPLLRPDFFDLYEPLTRLGLYLTLFTNATLLTPATARRLAQCPPSRLEVTLYGATPATYEAITGVRGSYDRCVAGVEALLEAGLTPTLKTTLSRDNVAEYEAIGQWARDRGLPFMAAWLLTARRDGAPSEVAAMRLSAAQIVDLEAADEKLAARLPELPHAPVTASADPMYCMAGKASFFVDATGAMGACPDLELPGARPLEVGFPVAWEQVRELVRAIPAGETCQACTIRAFCPTCPARARQETGAFTGVDPYCCEVARARQLRFGQGASP
jgi:radical SAM protein with 4Fe4S-binding SPASM domain